MNFINTLKSYLTNKELVIRVIVTLVILFVFRLLSKVPVPGIERDALESLFGGKGNTVSLFNIANTLAGGTLSQFSIISIGLFAFISASIIFQLLTPIVPKIAELRKMGETGVKIIDQWTRILTVFIAGIQAYILYFVLNSADNFVGRPLVEDLSTVRIATLVSVLVAGTMLLVWISELCSEYGLGGRRGGGVSILVSAGILASLPTALVEAFSNFTSSQFLRNFWVAFAIEWIIFAILAFIIFLLIKFIKFGYNLKNIYFKKFIGLLILFLITSIPVLIIFINRTESDWAIQLKSIVSANFARLNELETRFGFYLALTLQMIGLTVFLNESVRKLPIKFVNRLTHSSRLLSEKISYLPIKLLSVGVIPIIFASSLLSMPEVIYRFLGNNIKNWDGFVYLANLSFELISKESVQYFSQVLEYASLGWLNQTTSYYYHILHFIFTILFSLYFIFIIMEPETISNYLKRSKSYIYGIRPGDETISYLSFVILRIAFWGGLVLGITSSLPFIFGLYNANIPLGIEVLIAGGTNILILVSTFLTVKSQIDALLMTKDYEKFEEL